MSRGQAEFVIDEIRFDPAEPETGDIVQIEIDGTDTNKDSGADWNVGWFEATSPQLSEPILGWCILTAPGETVTADDSSIDENNYDGEFPFTESTMEIRVRVGGYNQDGTCAFSQFGSTHPVTDETTVTLEGAGEKVQEPAGKVLSVKTNSDKFETGDNIIVTAQVENTGGPGQLSTDVGTGTTSDPLGGEVVGSQNYYDAGEVKEIDATIDVPPAGLEWNVASARVKTGDTTIVTTPISVSGETTNLSEQITITDVQATGGENKGVMSLTIKNGSAKNVSVDLLISPPSYTETVSIGTGESKQLEYEYDFDVESDTKQDLCVDIQSVTAV